MGVIYCSECGSEKDTTIIEKTETYEIKGEPISVHARVRVCKECGSDLWDTLLDEENLAKAYEKYCVLKGLLLPGEVKEIRNKYGLSQRGIAALLGWSPATIARYEAGAIPSVANSEQLKRFRDDIGYVSELFRNHVNELTQIEARRVRDALSDFDGEPFQVIDYLSRIYDTTGYRYGGNRSFDINKLTHMVLFFAENCGQLVKSKLLKLLWYSDFGMYRREGHSISGAVYCHNYYGPIPVKHDFLLGCLTNDGTIETVPYDGPFYEGEYIKPCAEFDESLFSEEELQVLKDVLEKFRDYTGKNMTDISHSEEAYVKTTHLEKISYSYADNLKAFE